MRRVAADGATGTFETLATSAGAVVTDLTLSSDGGAVYWLDDSRNTGEVDLAPTAPACVIGT